MPKITLRCCVCGKAEKAVVGEFPRFGFEVTAIAESVGWGTGTDSKHRRTLVFCSIRCKKAALKKDGKSYRKFIPTIPQVGAGRAALEAEVE